MRWESEEKKVTRINYHGAGSHLDFYFLLDRPFRGYMHVAFLIQAVSSLLPCLKTKCSWHTWYQLNQSHPCETNQQAHASLSSFVRQLFVWGQNLLQANISMNIPTLLLPKSVRAMVYIPRVPPVFLALSSCLTVAACAALS